MSVFRKIVWPGLGLSCFPKIEGTVKLRPGLACLRLHDCELNGPLSLILSLDCSYNVFIPFLKSYNIFMLPSKFFTCYASKNIVELHNNYIITMTIVSLAAFHLQNAMASSCKLCKLKVRPMQVTKVWVHPSSARAGCRNTYFFKLIWLYVI